METNFESDEVEDQKKLFLELHNKTLEIKYLRGENSGLKEDCNRRNEFLLYVFESLNGFVRDSGVPVKKRTNLDSLSIININDSSFNYWAEKSFSLKMAELKEAWQKFQSIPETSNTRAVVTPLANSSEPLATSSQRSVIAEAIDAIVRSEVGQASGAVAPIPVVPASTRSTKRKKSTYDPFPTEEDTNQQSSSFDESDMDYQPRYREILTNAATPEVITLINN